MQVATPMHSSLLALPAFASGRAESSVGAPMVDANPQLDPIVREQARFRLEGSGPVSQRRIVPVSDGARQLLSLSRAGTTEAVRGVLRLVEEAAGGAKSSFSTDLRGIAFSDTDAGHGANSYRAHLDNDPLLRRSLERLGSRDRAQGVQELGTASLAGSTATRANAVAGWINIGPAASGALLAHHGLPIAARSGPDEPGLAKAIRVLRHEALHIVDETRPELAGHGLEGMREALAEAHSTSLSSLSAARSALGLDGVVGDAALGATLALRPYRGYEQALATTLRAAGIEPGSTDARELVAQSSKAVGETLVAAVARARGTSAAAAREAIADEFTAAPGA